MSSYAPSQKRIPPTHRRLSTSSDESWDGCTTESTPPFSPVSTCVIPPHGNTTSEEGWNVVSTGPAVPLSIDILGTSAASHHSRSLNTTTTTNSSSFDQSVSSPDPTISPTPSFSSITTFSNIISPLMLSSPSSQPSSRSSSAASSRRESMVDVIDALLSPTLSRHSPHPHHYHRRGSSSDLPRSPFLSDSEFSFTPSPNPSSSSFSSSPSPSPSSPRQPNAPRHPTSLRKALGASFVRLASGSALSMVRLIGIPNYHPASLYQSNPDLETIHEYESSLAHSRALGTYDHRPSVLLQQESVDEKSPSSSSSSSIAPPISDTHSITTPTSSGESSGSERWVDRLSSYSTWTSSDNLDEGEGLRYLLRGMAC
ncbi:MAG: hypothetical protein DHS80DRAFT_33146 [Piptocephalis tieghemiana]|nr:MAG: hypothetical protein DHS80DRAFT_33146 [Piptocephalis tieghemiana]